MWIIHITWSFIQLDICVTYLFFRFIVQMYVQSKQMQINLMNVEIIYQEQEGHTTDWFNKKETSIIPIGIYFSSSIPISIMSLLFCITYLSKINVSLVGMLNYTISKNVIKNLIVEINKRYCTRPKKFLMSVIIARVERWIISSSRS